MLREMKTDVLDHRIDMFIKPLDRLQISSADPVPKAGAANQMWSRLRLSLSAPPAGTERSCFLGPQSIGSTPDTPSSRDTSVPSPPEMIMVGRFSPVGGLADGKPAKESVVVGARGILGWGVALQNISSLQVFNIIQKREAERVFAGCECSSTFLDQMSIPQGTGLLLRFCTIPIQNRLL